MFAAEFEPAVEDGRRRSSRAPISLDAQIGKSGRTLCKVVDISRHGARLQTYSQLRRGSVIWLMLPTVGLVAAEVKWSDDFAAGCQFQKPLDVKSYVRLLGDAHPRDE